MDKPFWHGGFNHLRRAGDSLLGNRARLWASSPLTSATLDPTHESLMVELLAKQTTMPVCEAEDGMAIEPTDGSIDFEPFSCDGKRKWRITSPPCISHAPISHSAARRFSDRFLRWALTELALGVSETQQVVCAFACDGAIEIADNSTATHLYRIAQQAVHNALAAITSSARCDGRPRSRHYIKAILQSRLLGRPPEPSPVGGALRFVRELAAVVGGSR